MKLVVAGFLKGGFSACLLFLMLVTPLVQATPTTPTSDFTDNGDGTVTHKHTGLTWMRCAMGQTWSGTTCTGTAGTFTWDDAKALTITYAGKSDWRLPTIRELSTLIELDSYNVAINSTIFPNTPPVPDLFWSATAGAESGVWGIGFYAGAGAPYGGPNGAPLSFYARLVRGGPSIGTWALSRPTTDYVDNGDGTVTHTPTALTWKRCAEGQTWSDGTCTGWSNTYTWDAAKALTITYAGKSDWRLPTQTELLSLVDFTLASPSINSTIFPNTPCCWPESYFWSASNSAWNSSYAWCVSFEFSGSFNSYDKTSSSSVRLVRGGQTVPATTVSQPDCLFNWAEITFPQLFSPSGSQSHTLDVYYYRQYAGDTYLGISSADNHLYYLSGGSMGDVGLASQWYATAGCQ